MSSNWIGRELPDICAEAFDLTEGAVLTTVETRVMVRIRGRKRMLSESAEWFVRGDVSAIRRFEDDIRFYDVDRFVRSKNTAKFDWLEIHWPQPTGKVERFTELPIDRYITIVEGTGKWK